MTDTKTFQWVWFLDVVFGAIVALGIEKYEPVIRDAWSQGFEVFIPSLFVTACITTFIVYDIVAYNLLVKKFPYTKSKKGFIRFFLDLVMAFILYVLLVNALKLRPDWYSILITISLWHLAAQVWHLLARKEHNEKITFHEAVKPHLLFIIIYWCVAIVVYICSSILGLNNEWLSLATLIVMSASIFIVSLTRWNVVMEEYGQPDSSPDPA